MTKRKTTKSARPPLREVAHLLKFDLCPVEINQWFSLNQVIRVLKSVEDFFGKKTDNEIKKTEATELVTIGGRIVYAVPGGSFALGEKSVS